MCLWDVWWRWECVRMLPAISHSSASVALAKASSNSGSRVTLSMMGSTLFLGTQAFPCNWVDLKYKITLQVVMMIFCSLVMYLRDNSRFEFNSLDAHTGISLKLIRPLLRLLVGYITVPSAASTVLPLNLFLAIYADPHTMQGKDTRREEMKNYVFKNIIRPFWWWSVGSVLIWLYDYFYLAWMLPDCKTIHNTDIKGKIICSEKCV